MNLSIAIPTYNAGQQIHECLKSIEGQNGFPEAALEVLVNDDRSTDETWDLLALHEVDRTQNKINLGLTANWNRSMELAGGPVAILFHQDDLLLPGVISTAMEAFKDPNLALLAFSKVIRTKHEDTVSPLLNLGSYTGREYFEHLIQFKNCPAPSLTFFRKDLVEAPFYDDSYKYCPELDLYLRLARANPEMKFVHDERPMIVRGSAETQYSRNNFHLGLIDKIKIHEKFKDSLSPEDKARSLNGLLKTIDMGIVRLFDEGRTDQIRELFNSTGSRKWMLKNALKLKTAMKVGLNKLIRK